eukprot:1187721-Prymnesium_polylepis.2
MTHSNTIPAAEQCKLVAELQRKYPWVQAGTDFFDGSHVTCGGEDTEALRDNMGASIRFGVETETPARGQVPMSSTSSVRTTEAPEPKALLFYTCVTPQVGNQCEKALPSTRRASSRAASLPIRGARYVFRQWQRASQGLASRVVVATGAAGAIRRQPNRRGLLRGRRALPGQNFARRVHDRAACAAGNEVQVPLARHMGERGRHRMGRGLQGARLPR